MRKLYVGSGLAAAAALSLGVTTLVTASAEPTKTYSDGKIYNTCGYGSEATNALTTPAAAATVKNGTVSYSGQVKKATCTFDDWDVYPYIGQTGGTETQGALAAKGATYAGSIAVPANSTGGYLAYNVKTIAAYTNVSKTSAPVSINAYPSCSGGGEPTTELALTAGGMDATLTPQASGTVVTAAGAAKHGTCSILSNFTSTVSRGGTNLVTGTKSNGAHTGVTDAVPVVTTPAPVSYAVSSASTATWVTAPTGSSKTICAVPALQATYDVFVNPTLTSSRTNPTISPVTTLTFGGTVRLGTCAASNLDGWLVTIKQEALTSKLVVTASKDIITTADNKRTNVSGAYSVAWNAARIGTEGGNQDYRFTVTLSKGAISRTTSHSLTIGN